MKNNTLTEIAAILKKAQRILVFPHLNADGDALGSSAALCSGLLKMGKDCRIVLEDSIPANLRFLDRDFTIFHKDAKEAPDVAICVDCSDVERFPKRKKLFYSAATTICIDHHKAIETIADFNHIDSSSAATAELIYLLLRELGHVFDEEEAMAVYTGITTNTGNFLYSNTTARSHAIAREIMKTGMDSNRVNVYVYESESLEKIKLQGQAVAGALSFADGKGILATVTQEDLKETGAHMADTEGIVSTLRSIAGVEVAVLLKEHEKKVIKASLRAKEYCDVQKIAVKYNGGGHVRAAGCTMNMTMEEAKKILLAECEKVLES